VCIPLIFQEEQGPYRRAASPDLALFSAAADLPCFLQLECCRDLKALNVIEDEVEQGARLNVHQARGDTPFPRFEGAGDR
jgi:hypothetical protein